mgnify:CR=1 FL=1
MRRMIPNRSKRSIECHTRPAELPIPNVRAMSSIVQHDGPSEAWRLEAPAVVLCAGQGELDGVVLAAVAPLAPQHVRSHRRLGAHPHRITADSRRVEPGVAFAAYPGGSVDGRAFVPDAVARGATVAVGGVAPEGAGHFYPATVLADVPADARILKEEVFGPVAPITGFDSEEEGIRAANDTEYGLASYIYTQSLDRALRVAESIESGMVGVNRGVISDAAAPFGGIKESGFGREGGVEGIEEYLDTKYIALTQ